MRVFTHGQQRLSMEVDTPAVQATSRVSSASTVAHPATQIGSAIQPPSKSAGPRSRQGQKAKQHATSQQGICNIVAGVLEGQGVSQEDWGQSPRTYYQVDSLLPPEWSVSMPPGRHLSTLEGASLEQWCPSPRSPRMNCFGS